MREPGLQRRGWSGTSQAKSKPAKQSELSRRTRAPVISITVATTSIAAITTAVAIILMLKLPMIKAVVMMMAMVVRVMAMIPTGMSDDDGGFDVHLITSIAFSSATAINGTRSRTFATCHC